MDAALMERISLCALNRIFGFEPKFAHGIIRNLGSASAVFFLGEKDRESLFGPYSKYKGRICQAAFEEAHRELERLSSRGYGFIGINEEGYPPLLKECEDAPAGLYYKGTGSLVKTFSNPMVAIVGTRDLSAYGREWTEEIVRGLGSAGSVPAVVSGLAVGTDITAHRAALQCGLPTIAVMATGIDGIYPHRHREIAERIAGTEDCAIVTDYPPGTPPLKINFLRRNRIIAGISKAVILIESKIKGGGMSTARLAFSYNRDIYALPGRIDDIRSRGCNHLIREGIAETITSCSELFERLGTGGSCPADGKPQCGILEDALKNLLDSEETAAALRLYEAIRQHRGCNLEELAALMSMEFQKVSEYAGILECEGFIRIDLMQRCYINKINM